MSGETFAWACLAYGMAGLLTARMIKGVSPSPWRAWVWALAVLGWPAWWAALVWGLLTPGLRGRR